MKLLFTFLLLNTSLFAQNPKKAFNIIPEFPNPGEDITITYNPINGALANAENISGVLYTYSDFKWSVDDLSLFKSEQGIWESKFKLKAHTGLITCVFRSDTIVDAGGEKTYSWFFDKSKGAYAGWGILRSATLQDESPEIVNESNLINDQLSLMWINNEIKYFPESRNYFFYEGLKLFQKAKGGDQTGRIKAEIKYILSFNLNIQQQLKLQKSLKLLSVAKEQHFLDSIQKVILKKYPHGVLARDLNIEKIFREDNADKKLALYKTFTQNFPQKKFKDISTYIETMYYNKMYKGIAYINLLKNKDYSFIFNNLKEAPYNVLLDYSWHLVTIPYDRETESIDHLNSIASKIIPEIERRDTIIPKEFIEKMSPNQWKKKSLSYAAKEYLVYSKILVKSKNYGQAKKYLEKIKPIYEYNNADFNELYVNQLNREGKKKAAIDYIIECVKVNNATAVMLSLLQKHYVAKIGAEAEFDNYLQSLKPKEDISETYSKIISELINMPIEDFNLESNKGNAVKLSEQKGKIVVLDMWATWCAPCKKAMPGMQMAIDKYTKDSNVQFYFIDTQEYVKNYKEKVDAFLKNKNYNFNVLFDSKNPKTGKLDDTYSKYAKAFKFSGIPQKMIIDQNGRLRWQSTGYSGSPSKLSDEISAIIEYLKQEKS